MRRFAAFYAHRLFHGLIGMAAERPVVPRVFLETIIFLAAAAYLILKWQLLWERATKVRALGWCRSRMRFVLANTRTVASDRVFRNLLYHAPERWDHFVRVRGLDAVTSPLARGRPVVILAAHTGPMISPLLFHHYGIPGATYSSRTNVAKYRHPSGDSAKHRFLADYTFIPTGRERELFRHLQKPGVVVIYADIPLRPCKRTLPVNVLGGRAHYSTLPFDLGADVVLMDMQSAGFARYDVMFEALPPSLSKREAMDRYVAMLAAEISREPEALRIPPISTQEVLST